MNFSISQTNIDTHTLTSALQNAAAGACVTFEGRVRDHNKGQHVESLSYQVFHELAVAEGLKILAEARATFGLIDAVAVHREGDLAINDCAVWVGVLTPHRAEAFAACRFIIDAIKHRLPIWKKEFYSNGTAAWVNCQHHEHHPQAHSVTEQEFYLRQKRLPEVGDGGQAALKAARVLVVGAGGLGSAALPVLAGAGIGTIGIVEYDRLDGTNLHRQTLYDAKDVGKDKGACAAARLRALNPHITINLYHCKLGADNVEQLISAYDLILDCTDNFETKYLLNDAAILFRKPIIQASLYRFEGHMLMIDPSRNDGCLRCLWPEPPVTGAVGDCAEVGVIGSLPALFGALQAHQALAYFLGLDKNRGGELFTFDLRTLTSNKLHRHRRADCALCGNHPTITEIKSASVEDFEITIGPNDTRESLLNTYLWIDVREEDERLVLPLPEAQHFPFSKASHTNYTFPHNRPLLVICAKGQRSRAVAQNFRDMHYQAFSLKDGMSQLPASSLTGAA